MVRDWINLRGELRGYNVKRYHQIDEEPRREKEGVTDDAPLGFEPLAGARGPECVEGSQRLEFLTGFT